MNEPMSFERWWYAITTHPHARAYNNPLGLPAEGDLRGAVKFGWDAAMAKRPCNGVAVYDLRFIDAVLTDALNAVNVLFTLLSNITASKKYDLSGGVIAAHDSAQNIREAQKQLAHLREFDRAPETSRRQAAVRLLLGLGYQWDGRQWNKKP